MKPTINIIFDENADFDKEDLFGEEVSEALARWYEDERTNLDVPAKGIGKKYENGGCIVAFADMGLWYGRRIGAAMRGENLNSFLDTATQGDYTYCFYADRYNIRAKWSHHDGTHYVLFRLAKNEADAARIVDAVASGRMNEKQFRKATRSLRPQVASIYGW